MRPALLLALVLGACTEARRFGWPRAPVSVRDSFRVLERGLGPEEVERYRKMSASEFAAATHFGLGTNIRNGWGLWSGKSRIARSLRRLGVDHPEDQSGVILSSFWRHLHGFPLRLEEQLAHDRDYERALLQFWDRIHGKQIGGPYCFEIAADPYRAGPKRAPNAPRRELRCFELYFNCTRSWAAPLGAEPPSAFADEASRARCEPGPT